MNTETQMYEIERQEKILKRCEFLYSGEKLENESFSTKQKITLIKNELERRNNKELAI